MLGVVSAPMCALLLHRKLSWNVLSKGAHLC